VAEVAEVADVAGFRHGEAGWWRHTESIAILALPRIGIPWSFARLYNFGK
jgi:hypothetical protein